MSADPICGICGRPVTWQFKICEECQQKYGRYASDRPEWANFLVNYERRRRYRITNERVTYIEDSDDGFSYQIDFETIVEFRDYYETHPAEDSDGVIELKDSDWEAVYTWSI